MRTGWSRSGDLIGDLSPLGCPRPLAFCSLALAFAAAANPAVSPDRHPPAQLTLYFGVMGLLEGLSFEKTFEKTKESFHQAWALSLLVWTPVQLLNLHFVPLALQPTVVATVNVGWQTTLSVLNHYHEYGALSGRAASVVEAAHPPAPPPPRPSGHVTSRGSAGGPAPTDAAGFQQAQLAPPPAGWEIERARLRARVSQLLAENKELKFQLGQMHAAAYGAPAPPTHEAPPPPPHGRTLSAERWPQPR